MWISLYGQYGTETTTRKTGLIVVCVCAERDRETLPYCYYWTAVSPSHARGLGRTGCLVERMRDTKENKEASNEPTETTLDLVGNILRFRIRTLFSAYNLTIIVKDNPCYGSSRFVSLSLALSIRTLFLVDPVLRIQRKGRGPCHLLLVRVCFPHFAKSNSFIWTIYPTTLSSSPSSSSYSSSSFSATPRLLLRKGHQAYRRARKAYTPSRSTRLPRTIRIMIQTASPGLAVQVHWPNEAS